MITKFFAVVMLGLLMASSAHATLLSFDLDWSGALFSNGATATGMITLDDTILPNPTPPGGGTGSPAALGITDFMITISGAGPGNGTWGLSDFPFFVLIFVPDGLDLSTELVGQSTNGGLWGIAESSGAFNFIGSANAPSQCFSSFVICANPNTIGFDELALTSFRPKTVPEPTTLTLMGLALAGLGFQRRKSD